MSVPIGDGLHCLWGCHLAVESAAALLDRDFIDFHLYNIIYIYIHIYREREIIHHTKQIYIYVIYIDYRIYTVEHAVGIE